MKSNYLGQNILKFNSYGFNLISYFIQLGLSEADTVKSSLILIFIKIQNTLFIHDMRGLMPELNK
jgi:hypothetical protein